MKRLSPIAHTALDYAFGASMLTLPSALGLDRASRTFFGTFGAAALAVAAVTDTRAAVRPLLSLRAHRVIDLVTAPIFVAVPLVSDVAREPRARRIWVISSGTLLTAFAFTDWRGTS